MTALMGILGSAWPAILGFLGVIGGVAWGWFQTQQKQTAIAQAGQQVAAAQVNAAQANTQTAEVRDAEAQANATAAAAGTQSVKERSNVESNISSMPAGGAADQLRNEWASDTGAAPGTSSTGQDPGH